jgi:hypothetical protein
VVAVESRGQGHLTVVVMRVTWRVAQGAPMVMVMMLTGNLGNEHCQDRRVARQRVLSNNSSSRKWQGGHGASAHSSYNYRSSSGTSQSLMVAAQQGQVTPVPRKDS